MNAATSKSRSSSVDPASILGLNYIGPTSKFYIGPTLTRTLCRCLNDVRHWSNVGPTLIQPKKIAPYNSNVDFIGPILVRAVDGRWASDIWPVLASRATVGEICFCVGPILVHPWTNVPHDSDIGTGCKLMLIQCWATVKLRCRSDVIQT